ncbi:MAG: hypothetical protein ACO2PP_00270 [Thermocrinis sp.]|jgi:hypothetical protein|uniref:hypothetical protein n=1 Tax=Thermocrinis sp. TaxID=2024383 RepID=UPI003C105A24
MAVSPEDLAAGALALQVFVKNAKYVEMIVDIAFAVVPSVLGVGAAGLIGRAVVQTATEVMRSISLLRELGKLRWAGGGGGGYNPPTPAPAAPAAVAAMVAANRENPENKVSFSIILQPPTIKLPDKREERKNSHLKTTTPTKNSTTNSGRFPYSVVLRKGSLIEKPQKGSFGNPRKGSLRKR